jgi:hypothetical protein
MVRCEVDTTIVGSAIRNHQYTKTKNVTLTEDARAPIFLGYNATKSSFTRK